MSTRSAYSRNISFNYLFEFFKYSNVMHAFWMVYLIQRGYSLVEVGLLESIFHVVSFFGETPTGILADWFGRNRTRQLGIVLHMVYLVFLWQGTSFWVIAFGFGLAALSYNLESGSATAFVYDSLKHLHRESQFPKVEAKREALIRVASVVGSLVGGWLIVMGYPWAFAVNLIAYAGLFFLAFGMKETTIQHEEREEKATLKSHLTAMKKAFKEMPSLAVWMLYFGAISMVLAVVGYYVTTFWQEQGWQEDTMGLVLSVAGIASALGAWIAPRLQKRLSLFMAFQIATGLSLIGLFMLQWVELSPLIVAVLFALDGWLYVVIHAELNERIGSAIRASMLSVNAMAFSVFMMIGFPLFGMLVSVIDYSFAFIILAMTLLFMNVVFVLSSKRLQLTHPRGVKER